MDSNPPLLSALEAMEDYDPNSMPVEQARQLIQQFLVALTDQESINLRNALQRTLRAYVLSHMNVPPHDYSAMDGYALRSADLEGAPCKFKIIGSAYAGHPFSGRISAGECVRIMTGALIPDGCDSVVMQEKVKVDGDVIAIADAYRRGENIRHAGEDIAQGRS